MRWCLDCETEYPDALDACPNCGSEFFTDAPISQMPKARVEKGRRGAPRGEVPPWPLDPAGQPVKPVLLETLMCTNQMEYDMQTGLLNAFGIPTLQSFPQGGSLGKIILGFSGTGLEIFVPETLLEEAKTLLENEEA